jgi:type VI secretion system protein ImpH
MADQDRTTSHPLIDLFKDDIQDFDFFQVLRLIECAYPDEPRLGSAQQLADDPPVRFGQEVSLSFPHAALSAWQPMAMEDVKHRPVNRLDVRFLGLFGPQGPLPLPFTEHALERLGKGDHALVNFANVFHHRMLSLFYRAWAEAQPVTHFDRYEKDFTEDRFSRYLGSLFGLGMENLRNRDAMPDQSKLLFTGLYASQTKHAEGLAIIIEHSLDLPAHIEEFVGEWMHIDRHEHTRLGVNIEAGQLAVSAVLGEQVFGCQHKMRLVLGAMPMTSYKQLLPDQAGLTELAAIVQNYIGDELVWDVNLILRQADVPPLRLDGSNQLGWTSWLLNKGCNNCKPDGYCETCKTYPPTDAHDLIFDQPKQRFQ